MRPYIISIILACLLGVGVSLYMRPQKMVGGTSFTKVSPIVAKKNQGVLVTCSENPALTGTMSVSDYQALALPDAKPLTLSGCKNPSASLLAVTTTPSLQVGQYYESGIDATSSTLITVNVTGTPIVEKETLLLSQ